MRMWRDDVGLIHRYRRRSDQNFPPGPPSLPLIGNLHQLPLHKAFLQFTKWGQQYGEIVGLHFGPQKVVILNSWRAVKELFDQRGAIYSSRPYIPLVEYVVPGNSHLAFMKYDKTWRRSRSLITSFLKDDELVKLLPIQDAESTQLLWEVLNKPEKYYDHVMRQFCGVILASVYGQRGRSEYTEEFFSIQEEWAGLLDPGAVPPMEVFPWLRYVPSILTPWPGWKKRAASVKDRQRLLYRELFENAKRRAEQGKKEDMFVGRMLKKQEKEGFTDTELIYIAGFLIEAGADTTGNSLLAFILAMAAYPEVQRKAQVEVDSIFTSEKMPRGAEIGSANMPYLQAVFLEVLRWRPGLPLSIPHATTQNDTYGTYFIPAGTTVLMNVWAIHHNPEDYPNPDTFDPSRFLENDFGVADPSSSSQDNTLRRKTYAFGAARRVCAGSSMAEKSLLLSMAKLLWVFNISPKDKGVLDTNIETAFKDSILTGPKEVGIEFELRDESRRDVVAREWEQADAFLSTFE
ncbi:cytochrome P450 [Periconia macrospinosa]|uniref:Cytochrome P450 n=1 Tax=Periconia macrospinosa TaxID=97972 RepID=A0A2V1DP63_9PLEO|nr:cytochrome P450 [Periconia macrospinosa]